MKKFRNLFKLLTFIIVFSLSMASISFASEDFEPELVETFVINEFDYVNELKSMSDEMLIDEGYTDAEIHEIRELDLEKVIIERIKSNDEIELRNLGYTDEDMSIIEDVKLNNLEEVNSYQLARLSSTLTMRVYKVNSGASSNYSHLNLEIDWEWDVMPVFTHTDVIACTWSKGYSSYNSSYNEINYLSTTDTKSKRYYIDEKAPGTGCSFEVPLVHPDYSKRYVGKSGTVHLDLYDNSYISNSEVLIKYGHNTISAKLRVSYPGYLSIDFNRSVQEKSIWYNYNEGY